MNWYIAVVANNTERVAAEQLGQDYEVYLPAQKVVSVWKDGRRKVRDKIILPGKLLIRCSEQDRLKSCQSLFIKRYMVNIASSPDEFGRRKIAVVPDDQVERLRFVLGQSDALVSIENQNFRAGDRVRVVRGLFCGLEGQVADWSKKTARIYININHLGCASVEVNIEDVERC